MRRAAVLVALLALVLGAAPAGARCADAPDIGRDLRNTPLVFVGSVTGLSNRGRWAEFSVEEVWKGDPGGDRVEVRTAPEDPGGDRWVARSTERTYVDGTRYLVFAFEAVLGPASPYNDFGPDVRWVDTNCSPTQPFTSALGRFRPDGARVVDHPSDGLPAGTVALAVVALLVTSGVVLHRSRNGAYGRQP